MIWIDDLDKEAFAQDVRSHFGAETGEHGSLEENLLHPDKYPWAPSLEAQGRAAKSWWRPSHSLSDYQEWIDVARRLRETADCKNDIILQQIIAHAI